VARLEVLHEPDERLRRISETVEHITDEIRRLSEDMLDTMQAEAGCGLAAPQVGVLKRVFVINEAFCRNPEKEDYSPLTLINPQIVAASTEMQTFDEGCLSLPDISVPVTRPAVIRMRYLSLEGQTEEIEATGLLSVCLQHELDHLQGVLTLDYLDKSSRLQAIQKLELVKQRVGGEDQ
jgi:peptide deformylase